MIAHASLIAAAAGALALAVAGTAAAAAQALELAPQAAAKVDARHPHRNYGGTGLRVDGKPRARSYLRFEVAQLGGGMVRAKLRLRARNRAGRVRVREVVDGWEEDTITYRNAPRLGAVIGRSKRLRPRRWTTIRIATTAPDDGELSVALVARGHRARRFHGGESKRRAPRLVVRSGSAGMPLIAAAGDIACDPASGGFNDGQGTAEACRQRYTSDLLVGGGLSAVLALGDLQYLDGTLAQFEGSYDLSWGRVKSLTRPVPGNHEYHVAGASGYFDYFNGVGASTGLAGERGRGYYSYNLGAWHLIALNSNCSFVACGEGSPQDDWLEADLAASPASCVLAYWHQPRFSSGEHGNYLEVAGFWEDLYAAGADVVLNGHDHIYERFARQDPSASPDPRNGIRQFTVGTGGGSHDAIGTVAPNSEVQNGGTFGVLELMLRPDAYEWHFVPAAGGSFTDSGSDRC